MKEEKRFFVKAGKVSDGSTMGYRSSSLTLDEAREKMKRMRERGWFFVGLEEIERVESFEYNILPLH